MMDEMEDLKPQFALTGIVTVAAGIPAIFFLFQQDRRGYNFAFAWLGSVHLRKFGFDLRCKRG
ncbi:MAG: hypothetical protein Ct9H90mP16_01670 [Candidatus Poseidoniales archaeon]|nr:MAG: hypothetical protein Ct9H90mP16_01670 [Candidatus Poseidoniales archaeon]